MSKVLVVGFDGATFDLIRPLVEQGRLPTLSRLLEDGASGPLRSTIPPVTPAAWTTFFTGKNPGKHGIYDFQRLDPETYESTMVRSDAYQEKRIWQILGDAGYRSIILDVPFTYPPQPLNGMMITGYGTPRSPQTVFTYPADLTERLPAELYPEIRVAMPSNKFDRSRTYIDEWKEIMEGRQRLTQYLLTDEPWDFFMIVFSITDMMAHVFWTYVDPIHPNYHKAEAEEYRNAFFNAYERCDELLGDMMALAGSETTTIVLSDHGFGSIRPRQYIYQRLMQGGYIEAKRPDWFASIGNRLMKSAVDLYTRFPILREWVKGLRPSQRKTVKERLRQTGVLPSPENIDYARSKIILSDSGLRFWVNVKGRFGNGYVTPENKESLLDELSDFLKADRDSVTGKPIVAATYRSEDLYHGPLTERAPDLVIEYTNFFKLSAAADGKIPHVEGGHTLEGIFLAHGANINTITVEDAGLIDLTPTILYQFGLPIPPDMDGRVLEQIFDDGYLNKHRLKQGLQPAQGEPANDVSSGYSPEEEAEIAEQLRQLGYID